MTSSFFPLQVSPTIPAPLRRLADLAQNFWFSWYPETGQLFRKLDPVLWRKVEGNPKLFLRCVDQGILERAADDEAFLATYGSVLADFDRYLRKTGAPKPDELVATDLVAYFCAEFGLHESFPIYSGGLGVLAGDHCKAASDLGLPFVAVGLLYRQGYFNQTIDRDGQQVPQYPPIDPRALPLSVAQAPGGKELRVKCQFPGREVSIARLEGGSRPCVSAAARHGHRREHARGSARSRTGCTVSARTCGCSRKPCSASAVCARSAGSGSSPTVWHINEGHAAFSVIERLREYTSQGVPFAAALETTAASTVFTTHTPVSAGHDVFPPDRVAQQFESYPAALGVSIDELLDLGRSAEQRDAFNMTRLAIRGSCAVNGVSKIHGLVSSTLCQANWPDVPPAENPVGYVTNGVHVPTFLRAAWAMLLDRHLVGRLARPDHGSHRDEQDPRDPRSGVLADESEGQEPDAAGRSRAPRASAQAQRLERGAHPSALEARGPGGSERAHDRLRAAFRNLQARDAADDGPALARAARVSRGPARALLVRGQGAPGRRARAVDDARDPANLEPAAVHRQDPAARRLRHGHQPAARVRRRRVAQHSGASVRGERHVGHEGRDQRHGELERARRLVGRGLRRPRRTQERLGHSAGRSTRRAQPTATARTP